jgi:hypothetical protein
MGCYRQNLQKKESRSSLPASFLPRFLPFLSSSLPSHPAAADGAGAALGGSASLGSVLRAPRSAEGSVAATATPARGGGGRGRGREEVGFDLGVEFRAEEEEFKEEFKEEEEFERSLSSNPDQ